MAKPTVLIPDRDTAEPGTGADYDRQQICGADSIELLFVRRHVGNTVSFIANRAAGGAKRPSAQKLQALNRRPAAATGGTRENSGIKFLVVRSAG